MNLSYTKISKLLSLPTSSRRGKIHFFLADSRLLLQPSFTLFFALDGQNTSGHLFIKQLYDKGVRAFVVSRIPPSLPDCVFFQVNDVLQAMQQLAATVRLQHQIPIIGITGSNGKTIIKEWLRNLCAPRVKVVVNPRSYNSQIGVPLSVSLLTDQHQLGIFEAGISQPGEMEKLAKVIQPNIGVFTNIGTAHQEGFDSTQQKLDEKLLLFEHSEKLIYCVDQEIVHHTIQQNKGLATIKWTSVNHPDADVFFTILDQKRSQSTIEVKMTSERFVINIPFTDDNALQNTMHCCCVLLELNWSIVAIQTGLKNLHPVGLRLELRDAQNDCLLIDDTYSNDLTSLASALNMLQKQAENGHPGKIIFLSDLLQTGIETSQLYEQVAFLLTKKIDTFVGIGPQISAIKPFLPDHIQTFFYGSTNECLTQFPFRNLSQATILIKGARSFQLEKLSARMVLRSHRTVLEIDRNALRHNLQIFRGMLQPNTKLAVMVKAAAYGSGSIPVAKFLEEEQIDYLGVAYPDEGRELRLAGIASPILVLNTDVNQLQDLAYWDMEPEIYAWPQLLQLEKIGQPVKVHLKFDTGMHRLGFNPSDATKLAEWLALHPFIEVASIMSHLAATDDAQHDDFTHKQVNAYQEAYQKIKAALNYSPLRHVLNTSGILRFPEYHFDMVRLGIGLYGYEASGALQDKLQTVLELKASITQIREVDSNKTVGYGRKGKIKTLSRIATLNIGYADGLPRAAGNGKFSLLIRGKKAPTVGAVCMDMTMVDISHIKNVQEGDEVVVFGKKHPIGLLAAAANTIPYEILTNISPRVHRVQVEE